MTYNLGISGDTAEGILARFEQESLLRMFPGEEEITFIFAIGVNDSVFLIDENRRRYSLEAFSSNIGNIIKLAKKYSNQILFLSLFPVNQEILDPIPWAPEKAYRNALIKEFNDEIVKLCISEKLELVDLWSSWTSEDSVKLLPDGIHPDSLGHEKIYYEVQNKLVELGYL